MVSWNLGFADEDGVGARGCFVPLHEAAKFFGERTIITSGQGILVCLLLDDLHASIGWLAGTCRLGNRNYQFMALLSTGAMLAGSLLVLALGHLPLLGG